MPTTLCKIKIKNFGPIKDGFTQSSDGFFEITKVTLFIGNQGSGKSTVAKLISTFSWLEKALMRQDFPEADLTAKEFRDKYCAYQNIHNYFLVDTEIEYSGQQYLFRYKNESFIAKKIHKDNEFPYFRPKIMYIPAERNFLSVVKEAERVKNLPFMLYTFLDEFDKAKQTKNAFKLPINDISFAYDNASNTSHIVGKNDSFKILLSESSSGMQSVAPLSIVSNVLAESIDTKQDITKQDLSLEEKRHIEAGTKDILLTLGLTTAALTALFYDKRKLAAGLTAILGAIGINNLLKGNKTDIDKNFGEKEKNMLYNYYSKFYNSCFMNIVEEPEQNLYPVSQKNILFELLKYANMNEHNSLIITTHSPYILGYLSLACMAEKLNEKKNKPDYSHIVSYDATIDGNFVLVYELNDFGAIKKLEAYDNLPSDNNSLNNDMAEINNMFSALQELDIEWE